MNGFGGFNFGSSFPQFGTQGLADASFMTPKPHASSAGQSVGGAGTAPQSWVPPQPSQFDGSPQSGQSFVPPQSVGAQQVGVGGNLMQPPSQPPPQTSSQLFGNGSLSQLGQLFNQPQLQQAFQSPIFQQVSQAFQNPALQQAGLGQLSQLWSRYGG